MNKRVLIRGEGESGEVKVDQRAASPTLRITRTCVVQNLDLDLTGYRECIRISGAAHVKALIQRCKIGSVPPEAGNLA